MPVNPEDIRNIAIVGHSSSGKTMLTEAMLKAMGVIKTLGAVDGGSTMSDHDELEKERGSSVFTSVIHGKWKKKEITILDAPGKLDFIGASISAIAAAQCVVVAVHSVNGIEVNTRKMWDLAEKLDLPVIIAICRMDADNTAYTKILENLRSSFSSAVTPCIVPADDSFSGVVDLLGDSVPDEYSADRENLVETIVSADDDLMMRYMDGETITPDEMTKAVRIALKTRALIPVVTLASEKEVGITELLDFIAANSPSPVGGTYTLVEGEEEKEYTSSADGPFIAQCFKIASDEFRRVAFFRVLSGKMKAGSSVKIYDKGSARISSFLRMQGKESVDVTEASLGEILAVAKVDQLSVGDTLSANDVQVKALVFPKPMVELSVETAKHGEETKMSEAFKKVASSDPTFHSEYRAATRQTIMAGMGTVHLDVITKRLGIEIITKPPKIPYMETITKSVSNVKYRHKKQSGGSGQFAEVVINVEPNERGAGYEYINAIHGMAVSQQYAESANKGIQKKMVDGIIAGYPVVDLKVTLIDGKEHPVDSKDVAFQTAGRFAIIEAFGKAGAALLEPWVEIEIVVPNSNLGDIMSDIPGRRGQIKGSDAIGDMAIVIAIVPQAEVRDYANQLRAITAGEGSYSMTPSHYDLVPGDVQQKVIAEYKREKEEAKK